MLVNYKSGDIISYRKGESVVTHRISSIIEENGNVFIKTKGDNNNTEDSGTITIDSVEGKVINTIPKLGNIVLALQDKTVLIVVILFTYICISRTIRQSKDKNDS